MIVVVLWGIAEKNLFGRHIIALLDCYEGISVKCGSITLFQFNMTKMGISSTKLDLTLLEHLNQLHLLRKMEDSSQRKQLLDQVKEKYKERY